MSKKKLPTGAAHVVCERTSIFFCFSTAESSCDLVSQQIWLTEESTVYVAEVLQNGFFCSASLQHCLVNRCHWSCNFCNFFPSFSSHFFGVFYWTPCSPYYKVRQWLDSRVAQVVLTHSFRVPDSILSSGFCLYRVLHSVCMGFIQVSGLLPFLKNFHVCGCRCEWVSECVWMCVNGALWWTGIP